MGFLLLAVGLGAAVWFWRAPKGRAEWLLSAVVLLGVGFTQILDDRNAPQLPEFARPKPAASATSGSVLGGGLSYRSLAWLEEGGRRYIGGTIQNEYTESWDYITAQFEVFDAAGNSLGVVSQEFRTLQPKQEARLRIEVPFENANRFKLLRFSF